MPFGDVHFSSETDLWATPQAFFDAVDREFGFTLDACATAENAKCARFFSPAENGLAQAWTGTVWVNPPYGKEVGLWVEKAAEAALGGGDSRGADLRPHRHRLVASVGHESQ